MDTLEEERAELSIARGYALLCNLGFAFAAQFLELDHAHRSRRTLELVENPFGVGVTSFPKSLGQSDQRIAPRGFKIGHNGEQEFRHSGRHGVNLRSVEKGHALNYKDILLIGNIEVLCGWIVAFR